VWRRLIGLAAALAIAGTTVALAGIGRARTAGGGGLQVVAAESSWGSIAAQLGGTRVHVTSVIASAAIDPHDYEPTAQDARAIATARLVIANGAGYDPWVGKLAAAGPARGRIVLTVSDLVGVHAGGNPHLWYSPGDVRRVVHAISRDYARLDPAHASFYGRREHAFETAGLARYDRLLSDLRRRFHGDPVGASESVFAPLATALGLDLRTPASFLRAVGEGTEPAVADVTAIDRQIARGQIAVWVVNGQNRTPDVERLTSAARKRGIPVVTITETPTPAGVRFQDWQARQLEALAEALAR